MIPRPWPDLLTAPDPGAVQNLLEAYWMLLAQLAALIAHHQLLLAHDLLSDLRNIVLEMMLALNGIARPQATTALNVYLSASQRAALEKTMLMPANDPESFIGQAVALTVIYRWYAPQLVEKFDLRYPHLTEQTVWIELVNQLPDWPQQVSTD